MDENQVNEYRNAPLDESYSVVWVDALYEKIRDEGRVVNTC